MFNSAVSRVLLLSLALPMSWVLPIQAHAASLSEPQAIQCLENFISRYQPLSGYKTTVTKKEWNEKGEVSRNEKMEITNKKNNQIRIKYIDEGSTGIRNNGMTVTYSGGQEAEITLGEANFFGSFARNAAALIIGDKMNILHPKMIEDEILTLNRAGFDFLSQLIKRHLPYAREAKTGGVTLADGKACQVRYKPYAEGSDAVTLEPSQSIFDLEEKYGTLAYFIYRSNRAQFDSFADLFDRKKSVTISIPRGFSELDLDLDPVNYLPTKMVLKFNSKDVGSYSFENTELYRN